MVLNPEDQYPLLIELRREESARFWTVFSLMSAINGGLLAFSGVGFRDPKAIPLCLFGVVLCLVWGLIQRRFRFWVRRWEAQLKELEDNHGVLPENRRVFGTVDSKGKRGYAKPRGCWIKDGCSTKTLGVRLADIFVVFWLLLAIAASLWPLQKIDERVQNPQVSAAQHAR